MRADRRCQCRPIPRGRIPLSTRVFWMWAHADLNHGPHPCSEIQGSLRRCGFAKTPCDIRDFSTHQFASFDIFSFSYGCDVDGRGAAK